MNTGTVGVVGTPVKTRRYESPVRAEQAARTRTAVLRAARSLFTTRGYGATSVADIARRARVSVDTVYASVGRKPDLLLAVHDMILGASDEPLPAEERDYVRAVRAAPTAEAKIRIYADTEMCLPSTATFNAFACRGVIVTPVRLATSAGMYM